MIEIDATELMGWADALANVPDALDREMLASHQVVMGETINVAKENAPVKDGPLRADIRILTPAHKSGAGWSGKVGTDLIYAAQREYGGTIYPRNSKYLVFRWDQAVSADNPEGIVFAKSVTQSGSFYMQAAEIEMQGRAPAIYQLGVERALVGSGAF